MTSAPIYVVDDDEDLAASLGRMFSRHGFTARTFLSSAEFLAAYHPQQEAALVTDVCMAEINGFDLARAARERDPHLGLVFITAHPDARQAVDALRLEGGIDYLIKPIEEDRLIAAATAALQWSTTRVTAARRVALLSRRERQVFELLALGHTNKAIAAALSLSEKTVEDHRASIMTKTGSRSLADIIAIAQGLNAKQ